MNTSQYMNFTGRASQRAPKQKSHTTKSPLMQDWVFRLGLYMHCRASTGPEQGFPKVVFPHREILFSLQGSQLMKEGFSMLEILHRENPVFITGMGLQCD